MADVWCLLIDGSNTVKGTPFDMTATRIIDLKRSVQKSKAALRDVEATELVVWRSIDPKIYVNMTKRQLEEEVKNFNFADVREDQAIEITNEETLVELELLKGETLLVQVPGTLLSPSTSNESNTSGAKRRLTRADHDIETINHRIEKELEPIHKLIRIFLQCPERLKWEPPGCVTDPTTREFLKNLDIPTYANGDPSLLFHDLSSRCDDEQIEKIFGCGDNMLICNTSGSGKTRRMMEGLTKYWGFYLVVTPDAKRVGVSDFELAMKEAKEYQDWESDLRSSQRRAQGDSINRQIVSQLLRKVLAARIVVFKIFLELVTENGGALTDEHKHIWLLFQLSDQLYPGSGEHPFLRITRNCLRHASNEALLELIGGLDEIRQKYFQDPSRIRMPPFIIGLDEAQHAARLYPYAFISPRIDTKYRSILSPIITAMSELREAKLVLSGTGLSLEEIKELMPSGVSKNLGYHMFHELGMFDTWSKLEPLLRRYIPASLLNSASGERLQQRIREYLLGR